MCVKITEQNDPSHSKTLTATELRATNILHMENTVTKLRLRTKTHRSNPLRLPAITLRINQLYPFPQNSSSGKPGDLKPAFGLHKYQSILRRQR
jgi:hypothetical protein